MTGLWKEGWILATLSNENSNRKKFDLQIAMICTFQLYQKRKHLKYMAVKTDFTALLLIVLPNFLQISRYNQCSPLSGLGPFPTSTLRCSLLFPSS